MPLDCSLEKLPTEIILRIMQFLSVYHISIALTCPRMYKIFKDVHPQPLSLCSTGVPPRLDPSNTKRMHLKLLEYAWIMRVYEPKDYIFEVIMTRKCKRVPNDKIYRYQYYGRFLCRPYYDNQKNRTDLKHRYRDYELYTQCWSKQMPKDFHYPYPYNKGRFMYEMEMKEAIHVLFDSMDDVSPDEYKERIFFMWKFLKIGSNAEVNGLVTANLSLKYFGQWREMMEF
ncbi:64d723a7-324f-4055-a651-7cb033af555c-CDS [Sclerotinia trifoliorum]|uniref:64d723a7-324f-4055-a651-7cb033af555c-CDS n=1 Tax=Sclerotinia trifoliorum TaxID=28548 RepID=A0A8H2ZUJ7_9HELO|nr:64d723a7-324f-4055-a651-7cb033af555c-CDS [Sclerotinia trifoliorum]